MTHMKTKKGTIGILTGGGDVPGLNPAIRAVTIRAIHEGYEVIGIKRGWAGLIEIQRDPKVDHNEHCFRLTEDIVNRTGRTGGTFLHTSRTRPSHVPDVNVPTHLRDTYTEKTNDLTPEVLKNLEYLGIDYLIPIGGDDTLSYAVDLHHKGVKIIAIPKTMDNDVPGTDYCIGFSTCVTRTIGMTNALRTTAGSHERFLVIEVFGRYAGFTALLPTMAGAANRCVIPEYKFDIERLCELLTADRHSNPSLYSVVLVSEGAMFAGRGDDLRRRGEGHVRPQQARRHRRRHLRAAQGALAQVQQRAADQRHHPAAELSRPLRRPRRHRLDRPHGLRQHRPRPHPGQEVRPDGLPAQRRIRRRPRRDRDEPEEDVDVDKYYDRDRLRPLFKSFHHKPFFIATSD